MEFAGSGYLYPKWENRPVFIAITWAANRFYEVPSDYGVITVTHHLVTYINIFRKGQSCGIGSPREV